MIESRLQQIWSKEYMDYLPPFIKDRGYNYSINEEQKDILITGINPSFRKDASLKSCNFDFKVIATDEKYDVYWSSLKKMVADREYNVDYLPVTAYLDIFYFRETDQNILKNNILSNEYGINFIIDQIQLTQEIVEKIVQPKLIIVKNRESAAYWGKFAERGIYWMGYDLERVETFESGELFKIIGLCDTEQRVYNKLKETKLVNSLVFFTNHFRYMPKLKRPNAALIDKFVRLYSR